jgi:hypothetical protein
MPVRISEYEKRTLIDNNNNKKSFIQDEALPYLALVHVCLLPTTARVTHQGTLSVNHEFIYKGVHLPESQLPSM